MTAQLLQADVNGRTLTYVDDDVLGGPRVYVGSKSTFEDGDESVPMSRRFSTLPAIEVDELVLSPDAARRLAERLLLAAGQAEARCGCTHPFWLHYDGRLCSGRDGEDQALCHCGSFRFEIAREPGM